MSQTVLSLLEERRAMVARRRDLKAELTKLAHDITAVDRVVRIFDPDYKPEAGHENHRGSSVSKLFGHGEFTAAALAALRQAGKAASTADCAAIMLQKKGLEADPRLMPKISSKLATIYGQKVASGQVRKVINGDGRSVLWEVAR